MENKTQRTLESHLNMIFSGSKKKNPSKYNITNILYAVLVNITKLDYIKRGFEPYLEDFVIDNIPKEIKECEVKQQIVNFYDSNGYNLVREKRFKSDLIFIKGNQELGVNFSYSQSLNTCFVTVFNYREF